MAEPPQAIPPFAFAELPATIFRATANATTDSRFESASLREILPDALSRAANAFKAAAAPAESAHARIRMCP
jgi:hypothetical protein